MNVYCILLHCENYRRFSSHVFEVIFEKLLLINGRFFRPLGKVLGAYLDGNPDNMWEIIYEIILPGLPKCKTELILHKQNLRKEKNEKVGSFGWGTMWSNTIWKQFLLKTRNSVVNFPIVPF